ncbi:MAG: hypothetical protein ACD_85C00003G0005 [uncultured bacterium]|nr:MAG: hypothetical protein ACD_85C00003G0005 [uncultured bacterium]
MIDLSKLITAADKRNQLLESAVNTIRLERQKIIGVLDGLQASALATADTATAVGIEAAKQALRDLTQIDLSDSATQDEMKLKVMQAYYAIVAAAPANVVLAFREVLK